MKTIWKLMAITVVFTLIAAACAPAPAPAPEQVQVEVTRVVKEKEVVKETVVVKQEVKVEVPAAPAAPVVPIEPAGANRAVITAVKVDTSPEADGSASDEQWKSAPTTWAGVQQWQAVYTDKELTLKLKYPANNLILSNPGNYIWDPDAGKWTVFDAVVGSTWLAPTFEMNAPALDAQGCDSFCHWDDEHEMWHHNFEDPNHVADNWMVLGSHGFRPNTRTAEGLLAPPPPKTMGLMTQGVQEDKKVQTAIVVQDGPVIFDTNNTKAPNSVIGGNITFIGYAEDNVIVGPGGPLDVSYLRDTPRAKWCLNCHVKSGLPYDPLAMDLTLSGTGEIQYYPNFDVPYTAPLYMEKEPVDFADALIITDEEIQSGEAVLVAGLSNADISGYWANYAKVNGHVPYIVHRDPNEVSDQMAQIRTGANWTNGWWVVELQRNLTTPYPDVDVQFNDLTRDYLFQMSGTAGSTGPYSGYRLSFEQ